jgi:hypothetical protein
LVELVARLVTVPSTDEEFAAAVRAAAERLDGALVNGAMERLERGLRSRYPAAKVRRRDTHASLGGEPAWYVYRDGGSGPDGF